MSDFQLQLIANQLARSLPHVDAQTILQVLWALRAAGYRLDKFDPIKDW